MHIAIFNWRDVRHPHAGGAEIATHEIARRWAAQGHRLTWFAAAFEGAPPREVYDDITIVRKGRQFTVHLHAWRFYRRHLRGNVDVVIDQINTIPFFTPLYVREHTVALAHQLARQVWWYEARFPLNIIGYLLEPLYWQVYRRTPILTGSPSTETDLRRLGVKRISQFTYGMSLAPLPEPPASKQPPPTILYLGRVVPSKRVLHVIEAVAHACNELPDIHLVVAGAQHSRYSKMLKRRVAKLGISHRVVFKGRVSEEEKRQLMAQAHVLALASVREGWGLVVIEANAHGTPAVVYDVPGLRDSVRHNETGIVCRENTPVALGHELAALLKDRERLANYSRAAWEHSRQFTWDRSAREAMDCLIDCYDPTPGNRHHPNV